MSKTPLIFDLDGTLVDSVYLHVAAFQEALCKHGVDVPLHEVHKRIGMTGDLLLDALNDAFDLGLSEAERAAINLDHDARYAAVRKYSRALPGAKKLWRLLNDRQVPFAIATSAGREDAAALTALIDYPDGAPIVTKEDGASSKPAPGSFQRAAERLGVDLKDAIVVGDSVWDMLSSRRARSLGVGVLTGGYGIDELTGAGAFRVYDNVGDLGQKLDELGL